MLNLIKQHNVIAFNHYYNSPLHNQFDKNIRYIHGGLWSGAFQDVKQMLIGHTELLNYYINKHIIPQYHDETIFNEWYSKNPDKIVSIDYHDYLTILDKHNNRIRI